MSQWNWAWWFAWYPVKVIPESGDCWVWLVLLQRRHIQYVDSRGPSAKTIDVWEYR